MRLTPSPLWHAAALALGLTLATAAPMAAAQNLQALYEAAKAYDAQYLSAITQTRTAELRLAQSEGLLKPSASVTAGATANNTDLPRLGRGDTNSLNAALQGRMPLFNRSNSLSVEQARKGLEVASADLQTAEQDLIVRVAQAYFDVLAAQDTLATTRASKSFITEQLASARRNFEVGTATITDTREAQARFDLAVAQELAAENDLRARRIALDVLVGRTGVEPRPLATPVALPPVTPNAVEEWVTVADTQHPSVQRARVGLDVAQLETRKARAAEGPTVDLTGSLGVSRSSGSSATLPGVSNSATVGVALSMPLYTGGITQARLKETLVLEDKSRFDLEAARRQVAQATRVAFFGVQSLQAQVKALEAAEVSSKLALESTQLGYRVGVRVNLDVLNAQTQLFQTQRDLAKARYDVVVNGLRLRQASGQLTPADVAAVNRLLAP